jgi:hypothetical protein
MADNDGTERRVHVLPKELLDRIRAYQSAEGIASEVEAVRRLLNNALQMQDNIRSILKQLRDGYEHERNIRHLANKILSHHALVTSIHYGDNDVTFDMRTDDKGKITRQGVTYIGGPDYDEWTAEPTPSGKHKGREPTWQLQRDADNLDDEIPF